MAEKVTYEIEFDTDGAVKGINQVDKSLNKLDKQAKKTSGGLGGMLEFLKPSPMAAAAAGVAAIGGALAFTTTKTLEFDKAMSAARSVLGDVSNKDFERLREAALEAGSTTSFSAKQAAEGLQFLGMAGFTASQSIESLPGVLNLAAASGIELGRAADIASDVLSQFQKPASETNKVVDILAKTVTTSNQNMDQLADAMNYLGPTAAALKIPLEEAAAVTGVMASNGLKGSLGTRALGTSLVRLSKPTKQMKEVIKDLNLEFFDQEGQFIGLIGLTKELEKATAGMTDEEKQRTLATLFGAEAIQEMNILLSKGSVELTKYSNKLGAASGDAKKMAEIRLNNLAGDITKLQSATEGLAIQFGEELTPNMRGTVQELTNFIQLLTENKNEIIEFFNPFVEIGGKAKEVITNLLNLFGGDGGLSQAFYILRDAIEASLYPFELLLDITNGVLKTIKDIIDEVPEIAKGFSVIGQDIKTGFGLFGDEEEKKIEDPNRVLTDKELGFVEVEKEKKKKEESKAPEPVVFTPKTISSPASREAIKESKTSTMSSNVEKVSGPKTTNVSLSINKLVETLNINSQTLPEATGQIRDEVIKVLLTAANDVNLIVE